MQLIKLYVIGWDLTKYESCISFIYSWQVKAIGSSQTKKKVQSGLQEGNQKSVRNHFGESIFHIHFII